MQHSKGPWRVIRSNGVTKVVDFYGETICDDEDYYPQRLDPDNADIIAASPELLDCLKWITEFSKEHHEWFGAEDGAEGEWLEAAMMVIAKAEGRKV